MEKRLKDSRKEMVSLYVGRWRVGDVVGRRSECRINDADDCRQSGGIVTLDNNEDNLDKTGRAYALI